MFKRIEFWLVKQFARYCAWRDIGLLVNVRINSGGAAVNCTGRLFALQSVISVPLSDGGLQYGIRASSIEGSVFGAPAAEEIRARLNGGDAS